jgi:hypothetical protein
MPEGKPDISEGHSCQVTPIVDFHAQNGYAIAELLQGLRSRVDDLSHDARNEDLQCLTLERCAWRYLEPQALARARATRRA